MWETSFGAQDQLIAAGLLVFQSVSCLLALIDVIVCLDGCNISLALVSL